MSIRQDSNAVFQQFGLSHDPFAPGSNSFRFYKPGRRQVLEQLIHFARYSQLLLAVTGPRGSGKTVLRHAMAAAGKGTTVSVAVSALKQGDAAGLMQQLAHALQVTDTDVMTLLRAVDESVQAGKEVQVLVDDAEVLEDSALVLLQRLAQGDGQARCKVFLFGEPALQSRLQDNSEQPNGLEYHLIELEPWSEDEVEGYLQQRLQSAGCNLDLFTDHELATLLDQGQGWPGVINQVAQELLLARLQQPTQRLAPPPKARPPLPYPHIVALLVVAFLFIFAWYQLDDSKAREQPARMPVVQQQSESVVRQVQSETTSVVGQPRRIMLDLPAEPVPAEIQSAAPAPAVSQPAQQQPQVIQAPAQTPVVSEPVAVIAVPTAPANKMEPVIRSPEPVAKPATVTKAAEPVKPVAPRPAEPARPKVAETVAARNTPQTAQNSTTGWYGSQSAQHFTVQVFATANEQNARQFVQSNGGQYHYFRKLHNGQHLYVVTYGSFTSADAARSAIAQLPDAVKRNKPWPRSFASVRQEIR